MNRQIPMPLFILEMANNHMGCLEHGLRIIREMHTARQGVDLACAIKFQYRNLDSLIHPHFRNRLDLKYVKRFLETRLSDEDFLALQTEARRLGFLTCCTPFDEQSVDQVERHGFDFLKVASCSFTDWPLWERIAQTNLPIIASTAGASIEDIDRVVMFLKHRAREFALMVCVAEYPCAAEHMRLGRIDVLKQRYPTLAIGLSTHEAPTELDSVRIAIAKGASIFEKHVGVATERFKLNGYSAAPNDVKNWLEAAARVWALCGAESASFVATDVERKELDGLRRGVFAAHPLDVGESIKPADIFFAIPKETGQLAVSDVGKYVKLIASRAIPVLSPLDDSNVIVRDTREQVYSIVQRVKQLLISSGIPVPKSVNLEISHHYGLEKFEEYGLTMLTIVNREYCKKLLILLPGQRHPEQYHKQKEETFQVLFGEASLTLDGKEQLCKRGDIIVVERCVRHALYTNEGAVLEEISSTHHISDSFYTDPAITANSDRKTLLTYWFE